MLSDTNWNSVSTLHPSPTNISLLAVVSLFLYLLYNRYATPLRKIPGPFLASVTQLWIVSQQRTLRRPFVDLALHQKYGPIVRIAPKEVLVSSPRSRKIVYGATSKFTKGDWYTGTGDCGWSGDDQLDFLTELNMEKYRLQRRLVGGAYTPNFVKELEGNIDAILERNVKIMAERAGMNVNADTFFDYFASDCIQAATFGKSLGFVEAHSDRGANAMGHQMWAYMHWIGYLPDLHRTRLWYRNVILPKYRWLVSFLPNIRQPDQKVEATDEKKKSSEESIYSWLIKETKSRLASKQHPTHPTTIADRLCQIQAEKPALKSHWIEDMVMANFNAGVETIGVTISTFLNYVLSHPGCQERIQKEIDEARASDTLGQMPRLKDIDSLPYLKACLSESRRLHAPFGHPLARVVPDGGMELEGHWLPAGTTVGLNPWVIGRDKSLYGEDADVFRPERWLEFSPEHLKVLEANSMFFGNGVRSCPGQYLADAIYSKAIPLLMMNFTFYYTHPEKERRVISTFITRLDHVEIYWENRDRDNLVERNA